MKKKYEDYHQKSTQKYSTPARKGNKRPFLTGLFF